MYRILYFLMFETTCIFSQKLNFVRFLNVEKTNKQKTHTTRLVTPLFYSTPKDYLTTCVTC